MYQYPSEGRLLLLRNLCLGAAASCLLILIQLAQVGVQPLELQVTAIAASAAIPLWIGAANLYEAYVFLGRKSFGLLKTGGPWTIKAAITLAGLAEIVAVGGLIWHLSALAFAAFVFALILSAALVFRQMLTLAHWWADTNSPDAVASDVGATAVADGESRP
jgi:hypothetical protein